MKKIILFLLCFSVTNAFASEVPLKIVKKVATNAYYLNTGKRLNSKDIIEVIPVKERNYTVYYIINFNKGFVIVSADNIAEPILGLGTENPLNKDSLPPNLSCLLDEMKKEISFAIERKLPASSDIAKSWTYYLDSNNKSYSIGQHLINTTWA